MCGIAGIFGSSLGEDAIRAALEAMNAAQVHRGPDEGGVLIPAGLGAGLASRRLSIVDLEHGSQPLSDEDGTIHIVLNGEIYNHGALRELLAARGHRFRSRSDTEVIVHLYEELGAACLDQLHGMFALAILDTGRRTLLLARDGAGMKPLCYAETPAGLLFASEAKALLASGLLRAAPDIHAIDTYLAAGWVPAPMTAFRGMNKLAPGEFLTATPEGASRDFFWRLKYDHSAAPRSDSEYTDELEELFGKAVHTHLAADVPVGVFISGGWDSSLTAAFAAREAGARLKTFSIVFPDNPAMDESRFSRLVARTLGTDHHEIEYRSSSLPQLLPRMCHHLDEPCPAIPAGVLFQLFSLAASEVKTVMSGEGADELFGGYEFLRLKSPYLLRPWMVKALCRVAARAAPNRRWRRALRILGAPEDRMADAEWRRGLTPELKRHLLKPEYQAGGPDLEPVLVGGETLASCRDRVQRLLAFEMKGRLAEGILQAADRLSMAHSLEVRMPFLDRSVIDFALRLPSRLKVHGGREKIVVKDLCRRHLPAEIVARRKHGLGYPAGDWTREPLRGFVRELLLGASGRGPFRPAAIEKHLEAWGRRPAHDLGELARPVFLQLWWNEFIK